MFHTTDAASEADSYKLHSPSYIYWSNFLKKTTTYFWSSFTRLYCLILLEKSFLWSIANHTWVKFLATLPKASNFIELNACFN